MKPKTTTKCAAARFWRLHLIAAMLLLTFVSTAFAVSGKGKHGPKEARGAYNGGSESLQCETVNVWSPPYLAPHVLSDTHLPGGAQWSAAGEQVMYALDRREGKSPDLSTEISAELTLSRPMLTLEISTSCSPTHG